MPPHNNNNNNNAEDLPGSMLKHPSAQFMTAHDDDDHHQDIIPLSGDASSVSSLGIDHPHGTDIGEPLDDTVSESSLYDHRAQDPYYQSVYENEIQALYHQQEQVVVVVAVDAGKTMGYDFTENENAAKDDLHDDSQSDDSTDLQPYIRRNPYQKPSNETAEIFATSSYYSSSSGDRGSDVYLLGNVSKLSYSPSKHDRRKNGSKQSTFVGATPLLSRCGGTILVLGILGLTVGIILVLVASVSLLKEESKQRATEAATVTNPETTPGQGSDTAKWINRTNMPSPGPTRMEERSETTPSTESSTSQPVWTMEVTEGNIFLNTPSASPAFSRSPTTAVPSLPSPTLAPSPLHQSESGGDESSPWSSTAPTVMVYSKRRNKTKDKKSSSGKKTKKQREQDSASQPPDRRHHRRLKGQ